jgi:hypothetical protein
MENHWHLRLVLLFVEVRNERNSRHIDMGRVWRGLGTLGKEFSTSLCSQTQSVMYRYESSVLYIKILEAVKIRWVSLAALFEHRGAISCSRHVKHIFQL